MGVWGTRGWWCSPSLGAVCLLLAEPPCAALLLQQQLLFEESKAIILCFQFMHTHRGVVQELP